MAVFWIVAPWRLVEVIDVLEIPAASINRATVGGSKHL
jgi:hypothetical protein